MSELKGLVAAFVDASGGICNMKFGVARDGDGRRWHVFIEFLDNGDVYYGGTCYPTEEEARSVAASRRAQFRVSFNQLTVSMIMSDAEA